MYGNVACPGHATQFIIDDLHQRKLVCTHEVRSEWALRGNGLEFVSDGVKEVFATKSFFFVVVLFDRKYGFGNIGQSQVESRGGLRWATIWDRF